MTVFGARLLLPWLVHLPRSFPATCAVFPLAALPEPEFNGSPELSRALLPAHSWHSGAWSLPSHTPWSGTQLSPLFWHPGRLHRLSTVALAALSSCSGTTAAGAFSFPLVLQLLFQTARLYLWRVQSSFPFLLHA